VDGSKPLIKKGSDIAWAPGDRHGFCDLHDIGKNLVKLLMESSGSNRGFGGKRSGSEFGTAPDTHALWWAFPSTTGDPYVEETIKALKSSDVHQGQNHLWRCALTAKFVEEKCGADAWARTRQTG